MYYSVASWSSVSDKESIYPNTRDEKRLQK